MTQSEPRVVKCRFCDWTTPRFRTLKGVRRTSGPETAYRRLLDHIKREHPAEWQEIGAYLGYLGEDAEEVEILSTFD